MTFQSAIKTPDSLPVLESTPGEGAYALVRKDGQTYRVSVGVMPGAASMAAGEAYASFAALVHGHTMSDVDGLAVALDGLAAALTAKESAIAASTTANYLRGDKTWRDFATDVRAATQTALSAKQATLVSGTNLKTVNGNSLLGSGDVVIAGGSGVQPTVGLAASIDLNTVTTSGFYQLNGGTPTNVPSGSTVEFGQLIVSRGSDTIFQLVTGWNDSRFYMRHGSGIGGTPVWQPWQEVMTTSGESRLRQQRTAMANVFAAQNNMTLTAGYTYTVYLYDGAKTLYLPTAANTKVGDEIEFVNLQMGWGPGGSGNAFVIAMQTGTSINYVADNMTVNVRCGGFRLKCHWADASNAWWGVMV